MLHGIARLINAANSNLKELYHNLIMLLPRFQSLYTSKRYAIAGIEIPYIDAIVD
jgi:hypothetical protein